MMIARVTITIEGLDQVENRLTEIKERGGGNLVKLTADLASDTQQVWKDTTHRRSGRLQDAEEAPVEGLSFTLNNAVYYYDWVNDGHMTPKGWHRKRGYVPAKRRSHVEGQEMTQKAIQYIEENINEKLSKFLDNA